MILRVDIIRSRLWIIVIWGIFFSFPLQVLVGNPYPSLFPYVVLSLIFFLSLARPKLNSTVSVNRRYNKIDLIIGLYTLVVLTSILVQLALFVITLTEALSASMIYVGPVSIYLYFRWVASDRDFQLVFIAIAVAGLISGIYFCYDTLYKLISGKINQYAIDAFYYSLDRTGSSFQAANKSLISFGRSFGLLEKHSMSAAWILLGAFAALTILPKRQHFMRMAVICIYGSMVLIAMNITNVIALFFILVTVYFGGFSTLYRCVCKVKWWRRVLIVSMLVVTFVCGLCFVGNDVLDNMIENYTVRYDLLFGTGEFKAGGSADSFVSIIGSNIDDYLASVYEHPYFLVLGDGFSTYGMPKGGDIGWIESCARFGIPIFLLIITGLIYLVLATIRQLKKNNRFALMQQEENSVRMLEFAIAVVMLMIINELHYTIWAAKSIFPILFLSLALFGRCDYKLYKQPA